jgi:hypothetical protein
MKAKIIIISLVLMFAYIAWDFAKSAGPPPYYTNGPSENTCNDAGCHDGVGSKPNSGKGNLSLVFGNSESAYVPGKKYNLTITMAEKGFLRFGFQVLVLRDKDNSYIGKFVITDSINTQLRYATWGCCQSRRWIEHTFKGITPVVKDTGRWNMEWDAPAKDEGSLTFYVAALAGDGDKTDSFDHNYYTKMSLSASVVSGIKEAELNVEKIYFNRLTNNINIAYLEPLNTALSYSLYDIQGRLVEKWDNLPSASFTSLNLKQGIHTGLYILRGKNGESSFCKKLLLGE